MDAIAKLFEQLNEVIGKAGSLLVLPLVGVVCWEILMRYAFNAPTIWGFEATLFIYGVHFMLGLGLTEGRGGHVKVEILTDKLSPKNKALVNIFTYTVFFMPIWVGMAWASFKYAATSTAMLEANSTSWAPPIWPIKCLMALGYLLLLLEGIAVLLRNVETYRGLKNS